MRPLTFGVVTPTYRRSRLLNLFYGQLVAQTHPGWHWVLVHDGPSGQAKSAAVATQFSQTTFLTTPQKTDNYGATGRWWGARHFCRQPARPDYLVFWDDDDRFFSDALTEIAAALQRHDFPDLLLVPMATSTRVLPCGDTSGLALREKELTTANLVMRPQLACQAYESVVASGVTRATDFHAYLAARSQPGCRIQFAREMRPIGRADGLRKLPTSLERWGLSPALAWPFHRHRLASAVTSRLSSLSAVKQWGRRGLDRLGDLRFRVNPLTAPSHDLLPIAAAGIGDGRWRYVCRGLQKNSVVYSVGIGEDISFDLDLVRRFGCEVHAFDPTLRSRRWLQRQRVPPQFHAYPWGLAHFDGEANFRLPSSHSVSFSLCAEGPAKAEHRAEVRRLTTLMKALGHTQIDLLKVDIEGAEFDVVDDLVAAAPHIRQLLIEFHERLRPSGGGQLTERAVAKLRKAGYQIFHVSRRGWEYGFIR